jgi:hypothetical protein
VLQVGASSSSCRIRPFPMQHMTGFCMFHHHQGAAAPGQHAALFGEPPPWLLLPASASPGHWSPALPSSSHDSRAKTSGVVRQSHHGHKKPAGQPLAPCPSVPAYNHQLASAVALLCILSASHRFRGLAGQTPAASSSTSTPTPPHSPHHLAHVIRAKLTYA